MNSSMGSGCDWDWDFPLTDEDLQAIDAAASSPLPPVRKSQAPDSTDEFVLQHSSVKNRRRRLPDSLFVSRQQQQYRSFSLSPCSSNHGSARYYHSPFQEIKFGGHIIYSRTAKEVERAAEELLNLMEVKKREDGQCSIGLDIEWRPSFGGGVAPGKAAVMQICLDKKSCHVMHIIHSQIPKTLQCILEDPASLKVGVCIANDAAKVLQDYSVSINNLADLSDLANQKLGGGPRKWSLSALAEMLICRQLPKPNNIRLGNWEAEVLSKEQLNYAATDAYVSWCFNQVLDNFPGPVDKKCRNSSDT